MEEGQHERPVRDSNVASVRPSRPHGQTCRRILSADKVPEAFHTDLFADILAMQTRSCAATGGNHIVASVATVYGKLLKTRPDLIPVLAAPNWPFDT